jgi:hypothetical protein
MPRLVRAPVLVLVLLVVALAAGVPSAAAVVRHASPTGVTTGDCTSPDPSSMNPPCELLYAESVAASGDELIASPGNYMLANELEVDSNLHGAASQSRPVLISSSNDAVTLFAGGRLADLRIEHGGFFNAVDMFDGTVERVVAHTGTGGAVACNVHNASLIRDSVCWTEAGFGAGVGVLLAQGGAGTRTARLRNVTAVASGSQGEGIHVEASGGGVNTIDAKNVIAIGDGFDAEADQSTGGSATLAFQHSNYDSTNPLNLATITPPGTGTGNQTAAPLFAGAATGDFHQLAGSPTVNAGALVDLIGTGDFDGDPRVVGTAPDMGADEFVPQTTPSISVPSNAFTLGAITRNKKKGTVTLALTVPNPGELTGSGNGVKASSTGRAVIGKSVGAGQAQLLVKATGKKKRKLNETGKVTVKPKITYTPTGGDPSSQSVKVKLKKKL